MNDKKLATPRQPYDRKAGGMKPKNMYEVRVGGWAEVCVGEWDGKERRIVFGFVTKISDNKITLKVADEVQSPAITGIHDGDVIEVELEDLCGRMVASPMLVGKSPQGGRRRTRV